MDLITKISSLVACVREPEDLFLWWNKESNTPVIPTYWKKKGSAVVLKSFGSKGNVIDLQPYTSILATTVDINIKGWVSTSNAIVLVVDPKDLPSDIANPYLILAMSSDVMEYELVINQVKKGKLNVCEHTVKAQIGYRDRLRRIVRHDLPEELEL